MRVINHQNSKTPNRFRRWIIAGGILILLVVGIVIGRATHRGDETTPPDDMQRTAAATQPGSDPGADDIDKDENIYYCPMHPDQQSTDPDGTCPICGMELVEMPGDTGGTAEERDMPILRLTDRSKALMNIQVSPVERRSVEAPIHFVGRLEMDETRLADVVARAPSYVEKLYANYRWQMVEEGDPLAELYSPQVSAAARELLVVANSGRVARGNETSLDAAKGKLRRLGMPSDQIEQIVESGEVPQTYQVRSPMKGHVMHLHGEEGHWLDEGDRLIRIMDPSHLWVQLEAYERDLIWLHPGLPVELSVEAYPGETFEGEVDFIDPHMDGRTRTARVRIEVPNPDHWLKPDMFVRGEVLVTASGQSSRLASTPSDAPVETGEKPLVIPASAPLRTGQRAVVYVQDRDAEQPTFEGRQIVLGPRFGDHYLVREGLEKDELVVTHGAFMLDSELQIRGRPSMMNQDAFPESTPQPTVGDPDTPAEAESESPTADDPVEHEVPDPFAKEVGEALEHYFTLSNTLADDNFPAAQRALIALHNHLLEMDRDVLEPEVQEAWQELESQLHDALHAMAEANDIEGFRRHLAPLSEAIEKAALKFGGTQVGPLHRMHCPMALDNEGANWLQAEEQIRNPYMGEASGMLDCGTVEDSLIMD